MDVFATWTRKFRRAAQADKCALFQDHITHLELECSPESMLQDTISLVRAASLYLDLDEQPFDNFLAMQTYNPAASKGAVYALTINIARENWGRLLVASDFDGVDLADLFGHPWDKYKAAGFYRMYVSRVDGEDIGEKEFDTLEETITLDLRFDYNERELHLDFVDHPIKGSPLLHLQDWDMEFYKEEWEPLPGEPGYREPESPPSPVSSE